MLTKQYFNCSEHSWGDRERSCILLVNSQLLNHLSFTPISGDGGVRTHDPLIDSQVF